MKLSDLVEMTGPDGDIMVTGLTSDSRLVQPGYVFAALAGTKADGAAFIADAICKGAVAVIASPTTEVDQTGALHIKSENPRRLFSQMASRFYPEQPETGVAVTGTNGKTSVASFVRQIWRTLGHPSASIGTLGVMADGFEIAGGLTTPDPMTLHKNLAELKGRGIDHVACEASSHGLAQYRLDGVTFKAAAFTNLTRDHMDYHGTVDDYFFAKARLFGDLLAPGGTAVLNMNDPYGAELEVICWARGHKLLRIGENQGDIQLLSRTAHEDGQALLLSYGGDRYELDLPLVGSFQAENALVAAGLVIATGGEAGAVFKALETLEPVPGRIDLAAVHPSGARIYVDYAHTPDAIETVLQALRPHVSGQLSIVFGCGGDRDKGKRPLMGEVATAFADAVIVTDDNPRTENPQSIRKAILAAAPGAREIADRREAIRASVAGLAAGDILVVAGKGHELGQIIGTEVRDFSDMAEVRDAVDACRNEGGRK